MNKEINMKEHEIKKDKSKVKLKTSTCCKMKSIG